MEHIAGISRRVFLRGVGAVGVGAVASPILGEGTSLGERSGPTLLRQPSVSGAPLPEQLHVQFGGDAAREVAVSWAAPQAVRRPRLRLADADGEVGHVVDAEERTYVEALSGARVFTYHVRLDGLDPDVAYSYGVMHSGAQPVGGRFRTGPTGRSTPFRFTSFGDQSIPKPVGAGLGPSTPNAGYVVDAVEGLDPLFHLLNGDLCYANVSDDPVAQWASFFNNNMRSARNRAWMPAAGNHENEVANGPEGYASYQTRFSLPSNHGERRFEGNWYTFSVGNLCVISLNNDDVCIQDGAFSAFRRDHVPGYTADGDDPYIRGYSHGAQRAWLADTLATARARKDIDWIVVVMHQVAMSSAHFNGADLGIRQEWMPLFDEFGVDLVVAGHEHHFERTFPVRGSLAHSNLLTPAPQGDDPRVVDTTTGTVHMIIGGGGHPGFTPPAAFDSPHDGVVIFDVGPGSPLVQHAARTTTEPAPWSAYRDVSTPYGFASFDVTPDAGGGRTTITVTQFGAASGSSDYRPMDRFMLVRPHRPSESPDVGRAEVLDDAGRS